jgi:hypothetical protein
MFGAGPSFRVESCSPLFLSGIPEPPLYIIYDIKKFKYNISKLLK